MKTSILLSVMLSIFFCLGIPADTQAAPTHILKSTGIAVGLSSNGEITGITSGADSVTKQAIIRTSLAGCGIEGQLSSKKIKGGGIEFVGQITGKNPGEKCRLIQRFTPAKTSIRLDIEIQGAGEPWTVPIETQITCPEPSKSLFWTTWDDPRKTIVYDWADPMIPQPFTDLSLTYGGTEPLRYKSFCIPIATVIEPDRDAGISLILSPDDVPADVKLTTTSSGSIVFSRSNLKISSSKTVRLSMDIIAHAGDWRSALGWVANRYPRYFDPVNPKVYDVSGCGAYSNFEGPIDAGKFGAMGFGYNWKASNDYPFMGMFLPPIPDSEQWISNKKTLTSISRLREYSELIRKMGFRVLNYFNFNDFGRNIVYPAPPRKAASDSDLWRDANDQVYYTGLADAILYTGPDNTPQPAWENGVALDPGEPSFQEYLLDQAKRHIAKIPASDGICIDRMDYLRFYNPKRDDGVSWINGKPYRSLMVSWNDIMSRMGPLMHKADKVIYSNPLTGRIDLMSQVDGFYDEMAERGNVLNIEALLAVRKPATAWLSSAGSLGSDPYIGLQKYLLMGVFPTVPFPENDHSILPDPEMEEYFLDYGPLFSALKGRKWVLIDHAIRVENDKAKANLFEVPGGFIIPVVLGGDNKSAGIHTAKLPVKGNFAVRIIHPGETAWKTISTVRGDQPIDLDVPLIRGCAMVKLCREWLDPVDAWFITSTYIHMKTSTPNTEIKYTLDGTPPTADSPIYTTPVRIEKTTTIKMATFRNGVIIGDVLTGHYTKIPPSEPVITPNGAFFDGSTTVSMGIPRGSGRGEIRYTLDGSEPSKESTLYKEPISIKDSSKLKARMYTAGADPGLVKTAAFVRVPPMPPLPDVYISDLTPTKSTVGFFDHAMVDLSAEGRPMSIAGVAYAKGMGLAPNSELAYDLKPEYREFVAVVGVDDEMKLYRSASIAFKVIIDGNLLHETPTLRSDDFWHIRVPVPVGSRKIQLIATDAGDGINCDHADWANAGFTVR
ncbi:MAG: NPCBM/NEW2 domain-containing protein [Armatimonadota bacterium]